jgi:hypothetical protein
MDKQKQAVTYLLSGVAVLASLMVLFYYLSDRFRKTESHVDLDQKVETQSFEKSEFVGIYSPTDGSLEAAGKRISYFNVNQREEGGYLGTAKVDAVGAEEGEHYRCTDVRIGEPEFFLSCSGPGNNSISLNGTWQKSESGAISVAGKVLWTENATLILEVNRNFQYLPGE